MEKKVKTYDIIVIGAGHNGLTAACQLAQKGKNVLLLEKNDFIGGMAAGKEFHPGFFHQGLLHDTSQLRYELIKNLNLEKHGLKVRRVRAVFTLLAEDGRQILIYPDLDRTVESISAISKADAEAFKKYWAFHQKIKGFIQSVFSERPIDLSSFGNKQILALAKKGMALKLLGKEAMMELLKVAPMSVSDFLDEYFETDFLKAGLAGPAVYGSFASPRAAFTTLNLMIWECTSDYQIEGGANALVEALGKACNELGVDIIKSNAVEKIILDKDEKVEGVLLVNEEKIKCAQIASSCTPQETFLRFLNSNQIDYALEQEVLRYRSRGTTSFINFAVDKQFKFAVSSTERSLFYRTGESFLQMEKAFDPVKYRQRTNSPYLSIYIPSMEDLSIAPKDCHVLSVMVPNSAYNLESGWYRNEEEALAADVIACLNKYFPGIENAILASQIITPKSLESEFAATNGHIFHGEHSIDQLLMRPFPSCSQYNTPVKGLFLCGSSAFPGGGISCAPGALAVKGILTN